MLIPKGPSISFITAAKKEVAQNISALLWHLAEHSTDALVRSSDEIVMRSGEASARIDRAEENFGKVTRFRTVTEQDSFLGSLSRFIDTVGRSRDTEHIFITDAPLTEHESLALFARNSSAHLFFVGKVDHPHTDPMTNKIISAARLFRERGGTVIEINPDRDFKRMMKVIIEHSKLPHRAKKQWVSNMNHSGHRAAIHLARLPIPRASQHVPSRELCVA